MIELFSTYIVLFHIIRLFIWLLLLITMIILKSIWHFHFSLIGYSNLCLLISITFWKNIWSLSLFKTVIKFRCFSFFLLMLLLFGWPYIDWHWRWLYYYFFGHLILWVIILKIALFWISFNLGYSLFFLYFCDHFFFGTFPT